MAARYEEDKLVIKPLFSLFKRKTEIPYEKIERIEFPQGEDVFFYMKNGKVIKVNDPGIVIFYTGFGEMLRKYRIPYKCLLEGTADASIQKVREKADQVKEAALTYANRSLKEKLGSEYELDAKIVERIVSTTIEFRLLKNGYVLEEANQDNSIDNEPLVDEMDLAYLCEWNPEYEEGKYTFLEEAENTQACEEYIDRVVLENIYKEEEIEYE
ncbi:MAG: hypothetical protein J5517_10790 [Eubacterium sp.]|nr:hypothetical protein [Eubacterium sp.]